MLKGLVYCHECNKKMAVMSRTLSGNKDVLYFLCRTYQRFTSYQKCTCHNIRVDLVTEEVLKKVRAVCEKYIDIQEMQDIAEEEYRKAKEKNKMKML